MDFAQEHQSRQGKLAGQWHCHVSGIGYFSVSGIGQGAAPGSGSWGGRCDPPVAPGAFPTCACLYALLAG